jgi:hypothetical protein
LVEALADYHRAVELEPESFEALYWKREQAMAKVDGVDSDRYAAHTLNLLRRRGEAL